MRRRLTLAAAVTAALACLSLGIQAQEPERLTGRMWVHVVERGQNLRSIGSRHGIDLAVIAAANGIKTNAVLKPGTGLRLDNRHIVPAEAAEGTLIINVPQRMLFYVSGGRLLAFPVAVGNPGWRTPRAAFTIVEREENPTWDVPPSIAAESRRKGKVLPAKVPPGPKNPLGKYWLRLSLAGVGVHGTNAPTSVYQAVTHGCLRMHPDDIAELFPLVPLDAPGETIYQPILLAASGSEVFLEAHRDVYGLGRRPGGEWAREAARAAGLFERIDWAVADGVIAKREGIARDVTRR